ncbi:MAG TPA: tRNA (adenosine(37)-N6)-threonylcarbamoyltransferase complex dimerization subunit type 1 TsaB [Bacillota bacterium]|nr:tRNA (adenosine(37)-N6)-threonylcarbamoyltransferase complex dimerization subunit type 1 TsaB [Bacillota bacterium]
MCVLGIESATSVASAAVAGDCGILAERMVLNKRTHSVNLLPMIKAVMEEAEIDRDKLAGIAVSGGPGSFTGLRIGMSTAKALAQVWNLPLVRISTLEALVYPLAGHGRLLCPVLNARKNEVYTALYDFTGSGMKVLAEPAALAPEALAERLLKIQKPVTFLGDGVQACRSLLEAGLKGLASFAPAAASFPRGGAVAGMGLKAIMEGRGMDPGDVRPEYIRVSEAEAVWLKKHATGGRDR